jgi:3-dehydroquinate synthetase
MDLVAKQSRTTRKSEKTAIPVGDDAVPMGPGTAGSRDLTRLDFGHYIGHTIEELATMDPDYLHWLARHPSGARYRAEIGRVLGSPLRSTEY